MSVTLLINAQVLVGFYRNRLFCLPCPPLFYLRLEKILDQRILSEIFLHVHRALHQKFSARQKKKKMIAFIVTVT